MKWLTTSAHKISKNNRPVQWISPIGLPCIQPYIEEQYKVVKGVKIPIFNNKSHNVNKRKQMNAFPPNFVHSLDASHMMLTASRCIKEDINFVAVHDSYWCHNCDVDRMNVLLKEEVRCLLVCGVAQKEYTRRAAKLLPSNKC